MEINRDAPALLKGYGRRTLDKGIRSVLAHLESEAERRRAEQER